MLWLAAPSALGAAAPRARRAATAAADAAGARATGLAHASLSRRAASAARAPLAARAGAFTAGAACAGDGAAGGNGGNGSSEQHSPPSRDAGPEAGGPLGDDFWRDGGGFPHYLQSRKSTESEPCDCTNPVGFEPPADWTKATARDYDPMWATIRAEAQADADAEPLLSSFLYASVLSHSSFDRALAFVLANRLACPQLLAVQLVELCNDVLESEEQVRLAARCDLSATRARDPACRTHADCLLYFKGYHAVQGYRIAHALWRRGQTLLACALQSRISEVFAVDIHPAARIGRGILLDHGTGVVIGETAVVGDRVSILQGVTLGGTGKETGDRHPKIGEGVLIGAHATILGNIVVGEGAMIAAGSLVLKPVGAHVMVAGAPAKEVGRAAERFPALTMRQEEFCAELEARAQSTAAAAAASANAGSAAPGREYTTGS